MIFGHIEQLWHVRQSHDFVDIYPMRDVQEHWLGDECWCNPTVINPQCGGCGGDHVAIITHYPADVRSLAQRNALRDHFISLAMTWREPWQTT